MTFKQRLVFVVHTTVQMINLGICGVSVFLLGLLKSLLPIKWIQSQILSLMHTIYFAFGRNSVGLITFFNRVDIDIRIDKPLSKQSWYLLIANHLSYLDIILLIYFAGPRISPPKFFLKKELIWLPFVGLAAWALEMPFMRRYSRQQIEKKPHLRGKDLQTTRRSCEKYRHAPTSIINFVEGTRFTPQKHKTKQSRFSHLLPPKAGGIAFTLAAMGEFFTHVLDVSIVYPNNRQHPMMEMLSGQMTKIVIDVKVMDVPAETATNYFDDDTNRMMFQKWLNQLWQNKDNRIDKILG